MQTRSPAVQYLRMSTDTQEVSLDNQAAAIAAYAIEHGFEVVRTYADEGISGLTLKKRPALQRLLREVLDGEPDFAAILTYDVSRWGRFQDPDQAAHYEFVCREAGVQVHYCAEAFQGEGSIYATLFKSMKRAMAAEFSRELSVKVRAAHVRYLERGLWPVGRAPYGYRRALIDRQGQVLRVLNLGEYRAIRGSRVVLVPGPQGEIDTVREVFRLYVEEGLKGRIIAERLNETGAPPGPSHKRWQGWRIRRMLDSEVYAGTLVYGRMSAVSVGGPVRLTPRETWARRVDAVEPLISRELFERAQARRLALRPFTDGARILEAMSAFVAREGQITCQLMDTRPDLPGSDVVRKWFGSVRVAYQLIGYKPLYTGPPRRIDGYEMALQRLLNARAALPQQEQPPLKVLWRKLRKRGYRGGYITFLRTAASMPGPRLFPDWLDCDNDELLERLKRLYARHGRLTRKLIDADDDLPSSACIAQRFGGCMRAYALAGYVPPPDSQAAWAAALAVRRRLKPPGGRSGAPGTAG